MKRDLYKMHVWCLFCQFMEAIDSENYMEPIIMCRIAFMVPS